MNKKTCIVAGSLVIAASLWGGCAKPKPKVNAPVAEDVQEQMGSTEVASGDLREAMLALQKVHFALNSSELSEESRSALAKAAPTITKEKVSLNVDGHTDSRGTEEYNAALGEERALTVVNYLKSLGVPATQLSAHSFGEEKLVSDASTSEANAENRRVEFRVMRGNVRLVLEEGTLLDDQGKAIPSQAK